jgi:hypothetical protein
MIEAELLAGKALRLLKELDQVLVGDVLRLNGIELSIFEEGLIYESRQLYTDNTDIIRRYEHEVFLNQKGTDQYLNEIKKQRKGNK